MSKTKLQTQARKLDPDLLAHINVLGLSSVDGYQEWCVRNGFDRKLNKHWKQRRREQDHAQGIIAQGRLGQKKRESRQLNHVLLEICSRTMTASDVTQPYLKRLCKILRTGKHPNDERHIDRKALQRLLIRLHECRAKLFDGTAVIPHLGELPGNTYIEAIAQIAAHGSSWLRPLSTWKPKSHNAGRQFASLLRHLFVQYDDVPLFFDSVWFAGPTKAAVERRKWYLHVGRGQNIRHCQLPIVLTKKMAHAAMRAPNDVSVEQALRWGQVLGLGSDKRFARAILATRLGEHFEADEFWITVIRWFVAHPMLDPAHVGPIVDYLHYQRFVPEIHFVDLQPDEELRPAQPNLSMKGRTPEALIRQVNNWHRSLANDNRHQIQQWSAHGIQGLDFMEGSLKGGNLKIWTVRELLSSKALFSEGRQLKHCVATYASSCARGQCSIWTMEMESLQSRTKLLTIEVSKGSQFICQVRGKHNRLATAKELKIIRRWADQAGLKLASSVGCD
ncbi:MAG: PcfJ domain-containing protein [Fuerstiella sp.]